MSDRDSPPADADDQGLPQVLYTAEERVLGGMLLESDFLATVHPLLTPAMFQDFRSALIYTAISDLKATGQPVDVLTVAIKLRAQTGLDAVGAVSESEVAALLDPLPTLETIGAEEGPLTPMVQQDSRSWVISNAMFEISDTHQSITAPMVREWLEQQTALDVIGGTSYVTSLLLAVSLPEEAWPDVARLRRRADGFG